MLYMTLDSITTLISSIGFPIAMCIMMFYYLQEESSNHKNEVESLKEAFNSNTQILTELKQMINDFMHNEKDGE